MATKKALNRLEILLQAKARAERQARNLAATFDAVIQEIDAVKDDADIAWTDEVLAEETSGAETSFRLLKPPAKAGSLTLYLDGVPTVAYTVNLDTGIITPTGAVPAGKRVTADYTQLGLKSQVVEILESIPSVSVDDFAADIAHYQTAIAWITEHFPA